MMNAGLFGLSDCPRDNTTQLLLLKIAAAVIALGGIGIISAHIVLSIRHRRYGFGRVLLQVILIFIASFFLVNQFLVPTTYRCAGANSAAKSSINNMKGIAGLYYEDNNSTYIDLCSSDSMSPGLESASNATGKPTSCFSNSTGYAIEVQLKGNEGYFCMDSTGFVTVTKVSSDLNEEESICDGE